MKILPVIIKNDQVSFTATFEEIPDSEPLSVTYSTAGLIDDPDDAAVVALQDAFTVLAELVLAHLTPDVRVVYIDADTKEKMSEAEAKKEYSDADVDIPGEKTKDDPGDVQVVTDKT